MTVWTGVRDNEGENWTTPDYPGYLIQHIDGASWYTIWADNGQRLIDRVDKFAKGEGLVRSDAERVGQAAQVEDAPRTEGRCGHWIVRRDDQWEHWAAHDGGRCRTRLPLEPA